MKIRIQDSSVRFRITLKEIEELRRDGKIVRQTQVHSSSGPCGQFTYEIRSEVTAVESHVVLGPFSITLLLAEPDLSTLCEPSQEGVYIRHEIIDGENSPHRFIAFVEKDRPSSKCDKPEEWIYHQQPGKPPVTRPITSI